MRIIKVVNRNLTLQAKKTNNQQIENKDLDTNVTYLDKDNTWYRTDRTVRQVLKEGSAKENCADLRNTGKSLKTIGQVEISLAKSLRTYSTKEQFTPKILSEAISLMEKTRAEFKRLGVDVDSNQYYDSVVGKLKLWRTKDNLQELTSPIFEDLWGIASSLTRGGTRSMKKGELYMNPPLLRISFMKEFSDDSANEYDMDFVDTGKYLKCDPPQILDKKSIEQSKQVNTTAMVSVDPSNLRDYFSDFGKYLLSGYWSLPDLPMFPIFLGISVFTNVLKKNKFK
ncbi:MAG: hypothetical protein QNJ31_05800 [Candidatus Caenarcaniphilales bacterium]|nr:hypothetical protein [Candidatus Caenarcaniphilales bacterium]